MHTLAGWLEQNMLPCYLKALTGADCPGCGIQRSLVALLKGNVVDSIYLYPPLFPMLAMVLFLCAHLKFRFTFGAALLKWMFIGNTVIMLINYFIKMYSHVSIHH